MGDVKTDTATLERQQALGKIMAANLISLAAKQYGAKLYTAIRCNPSGPDTQTLIVALNSMVEVARRAERWTKRVAKTLGGIDNMELRRIALTMQTLSNRYLGTQDN